MMAHERRSCQRTTVRGTVRPFYGRHHRGRPVARAPPPDGRYGHRTAAVAHAPTTTPRGTPAARPSQLNPRLRLARTGTRATGRPHPRASLLSLLSQPPLREASLAGASRPLSQPDEKGRKRRVEVSPRRSGRLRLRVRLVGVVRVRRVRGRGVGGVRLRGLGAWRLRRVLGLVRLGCRRGCRR